MNKANLPQKLTQAGGEIESRRVPAVSPTRRGVAIAGWALLGGGLVAIAGWGAGMWSILAAGAGAFLIIVERRRATSSGADATDAGSGLREIGRYVSKTQYLERVGGLGEQAAAQLAQVSARFTRFQELLVQKFDPGEITYARYHAAAEQLYLSVLDNLRLAATTLNNIDAIDPRRIDDRLRALADKNDAASAAEVQDLQERRHFRQQQVAGVRESFVLNERAITEFDRVQAALSATQTRKGASDVGLESAMAELAQLAERAKKYQINR